MSAWLLSEKAVDELLDTVRQLVGGAASDVVQALIARDGVIVEKSVEQWCWFYGGEHPDEAAGAHYEEDEAAAREMPQWLVEGSVASRPVAFGRWVVNPPEQG